MIFIKLCAENVRSDQISAVSYGAYRRKMAYGSDLKVLSEGCNREVYVGKGVKIKKVVRGLTLKIYSRLGGISEGLIVFIEKMIRKIKIKI